MNNPIKGVNIRVHPLFFDEIFEKNRKQMQKRLKRYDLTQINFTKILAENKAKIVFPKNKRRKK